MYIIFGEKRRFVAWSVWSSVTIVAAIFLLRYLEVVGQSVHSFLSYSVLICGLILTGYILKDSHEVSSLNNILYGNSGNRRLSNFAKFIYICVALSIFVVNDKTLTVAESFAYGFLISICLLAFPDVFLFVKNQKIGDDAK